MVAHLDMSMGKRERLNDVEEAILSSACPFKRVRVECARWIREYQDYHHDVLEKAIAQRIELLLESSRQDLPVVDLDIAETAAKELERFKGSAESFSLLVDNYCNSVTRDAPADNMTIFAASKIMDRDIHLFRDASAYKLCFKEDLPRERRAIHLRCNDEHYDLLVPVFLFHA